MYQLWPTVSRLSTRRPQLAHFLCIITDHNINVRASIETEENLFIQRRTSWTQEWFFEGKIPLKGLKFFSRKFKIKLVGLDSKQQPFYSDIFESDSVGNFNFKIPLTEKTKEIKAIQLYEVGQTQKLEYYLGTFIPLFVRHPKRIVICDFDKTLLETKFSSVKELYTSLTTPLGKFPPLEDSVTLIKSFIEREFHLFIVSSSPHFYEDAIRDWLYTRGIHPAGIFLKDYRKIFSLFDLELTAKDIRNQGVYKLSQLMNILLMTGPPQDLVLVGDNFESDPLIYLTLAMILYGDHRPWDIWNQLKREEDFKLNKHQDADFLNKMYLIEGLMARFKEDSLNLKIYIRKTGDSGGIHIPDFFQRQLGFIEFYGQ